MWSSATLLWLMSLPLPLPLWSSLLNFSISLNFFLSLSDSLFLPSLSLFLHLYFSLLSSMNPSKHTWRPPSPVLLCWLRISLSALWAYSQWMNRWDGTVLCASPPGRWRGWGLDGNSVCIRERERDAEMCVYISESSRVRERGWETYITSNAPLQADSSNSPPQQGISLRLHLSELPPMQLLYRSLGCLGERL